MTRNKDPQVVPCATSLVITPRTGRPEEAVDLGKIKRRPLNQHMMAGPRALTLRIFVARNGILATGHRCLEAIVGRGQ